MMTDLEAELREKVARVLDTAADLLEDEGWVQRTLRNNQGYCAIGAMNASARRYVDRNIFNSSPLSYAASVALSEELGLGKTIVMWNDKPGRCADEVIDHMRWAAKGVREETISIPQGILNVLGEIRTGFLVD